MNATPREPSRSQARFTQRELWPAGPSLICNSKVLGKQTNSSPVNLAPVADRLRTSTSRAELPLLKMQRASR